MVALLAGVLAGGLAQLGAQRVLDVGEAGVVARAEVDREVVGHDAAALDVDGAVVVHLADEPATELDRADGCSRNARNTPSTIRSRRRSNDCKPMVEDEATGVLGLGGRRREGS